jgi:hypothetical protein
MKPVNDIFVFDCITQRTVAYGMFILKLSIRPHNFCRPSWQMSHYFFNRYLKFQNNKIALIGTHLVKINFNN